MNVYITKASKYLPNDPIGNEQMESYLGLINQNASKARRIVLRNNGILKRYYALDAEGNPTHSNAQLTALVMCRGMLLKCFRVALLLLMCCCLRIVQWYTGF